MIRLSLIMHDHIIPPARNDIMSSVHSSFAAFSDSSLTASTSSLLIFDRVCYTIISTFFNQLATIAN